MATKTVKTPKAEAKAPPAPKAVKPAAAKTAKPKADKAEGEAKPAKKAASGLTKPVHPSKELAAIVGHDSLPRTQVISKVWEHIRAHNLQNPSNKQEILADDKLKVLFGKDKATMFEMNKLLSPHMK